MPFVLISVGMTLVITAMMRPLFEWDVKVKETDLLSTYQIRVLPSPWNTKMGEAVDTALLPSGKVTVWDGKSRCVKADNLTLRVERTSSERLVEAVANDLGQSIGWFVWLGLVGIALALLYMAWVILDLEHQSITNLITAGMGAVGWCGLLAVILTLLGPAVSSDFFTLDTSDRCQGSIVLQIRVLHYETVVLMLTGVLMELGAYGLMVYRVMSTLRRKIAKRVTD